MIGSPQVKTKINRLRRKVGAEARPLRKNRQPLDDRVRAQSVGVAEVILEIGDPAITTAENQVNDPGAEVPKVNTDIEAEIGDTKVETDRKVETMTKAETDMEAETDTGAETDTIPGIDIKSIPGNSGKSSEERARFT